MFTALEIADNVPWYTAHNRVLTVHSLVDKWLYVTAAVSGTAFAVHPLEVLRQKYMVCALSWLHSRFVSFSLQAQSDMLPRKGGVQPRFNTVPELLVNTWKQGGVMAFYSGFGSTLFRVSVFGFAFRQ